MHKSTREEDSTELLRKLPSIALPADRNVNETAFSLCRNSNFLLLKIAGSRQLSCNYTSMKLPLHHRLADAVTKPRQDEALGGSRLFRHNLNRVKRKPGLSLEISESDCRQLKNQFVSSLNVENPISF